MMPKIFVLIAAIFISITGGVHADSLKPYSDVYWTEVLNQYADNGYFRYNQALRDTHALDWYLRGVENLSRDEFEKWSEDDQIAFLINVYNASTIRLILDHYPLKRQFSLKAAAYPKNSIQQIPNVWNRPVIQLFKKQTSLNDIEHNMLRKQFNEPRIHFALVCASKGCPDLRDEPYNGEELNNQLDEQTRGFISHPEKVLWDGVSNKLYLSKIFKWFEEDFDDEGGVVAFVAKYLNHAKLKTNNSDIKLDSFPYDWSLNEA